MDTEEARQKRKDLEDDILELVKRFEMESSLVVTDIRLDTEQGMMMKRCVYGIEIDVELNR
jgi:hypothetical protein